MMEKTLTLIAIAFVAITLALAISFLMGTTKDVPMPFEKTPIFTQPVQPIYDDSFNSKG